MANRTLQKLPKTGAACRAKGSRLHQPGNAPPGRGAIAGIYNFLKQKLLRTADKGERKICVQSKKLRPLEMFGTGRSKDWRPLEIFGTGRSKESGPLEMFGTCLLYTSPSPRDGLLSRMPSSA